MTQHLSCPDPARLRELLDDTLPHGEQVELNRHLETCVSCQQALEGMAAAASARTAVDTTAILPNFSNMTRLLLFVWR